MYAFRPEERDSVAARLSSLFTLPAQIFELMHPDGSIKVKMRLLNDRENQDVADVADRYGLASRMIVQRREVLARSVMWIEDIPVEMPESVQIAIKDQTGADPTEVEQKLWVFAQCQPILLADLMRFYDEMVDEQKRGMDEIKKKFAEQPEKPQPEIKSSE